MSETSATRTRRLVDFARGIGMVEGDSEQLRLPRTMLATLMTVVGVLAVGWGAIYAAFDEPAAAALPFLYAGLTGILVVVLRRTGDVGLVLLAQLLLIVFIPFALAVTLGGFVASSGVVLWSLLGPIAAFLIGGRRGALFWLAIYLLLVALLAVLHPWLRDDNNLPTAIVLAFFVLNLGTVSAISFGLIFYFVGENQRVQGLLLRQEEEMRQTEKISALGKLSAGLAHELNNPAAAAQRASSQLRESLARVARASVEMGEASLAPARWTALADAVESDRGASTEMSALERADREEALADWLASHGVENAWQLAPALAAAGVEASTLEELTAEMSPAAVPAAVAWVSESLTAAELLGTLTSTTTSMLELVGAVKSYSYMDQAQEQEIDIHEGIENTITILGHKVKQGVTITRQYDRTLPTVVIAGGELNQVWTNLLDNAIDAAGPTGEVRIATLRDADRLVVEIADNGPGIPVDIQPRIFDPFFTTKDVGEGTGLGLDIARRIVTDRCGGEIAFESQPGATRFWVRLPLP
jgi:signal transduction histidine kinase